MQKKLISDVKSKANELNVPIIFDETALFLEGHIKEFQPKKILEIGTATGYSSFVMLSAFGGAKVTSIEIDKTRFKLAKENLKAFRSRVKLINADAQKVIKRMKKESFDLIFLDGPKGQYGRYFKTLVSLLKKGGCIIADNIYFHGTAIGLKPYSRGMRAMIKGLHDFVVQAKTSTLKVEEFSQGDGILRITKE